MNKGINCITWKRNPAEPHTYFAYFGETCIAYVGYAWDEEEETGDEYVYYYWKDETTGDNHFGNDNGGYDWERMSEAMADCENYFANL